MKRWLLPGRAGIDHSADSLNARLCRDGSIVRGVALMPSSLTRGLALQSRRSHNSALCLVAMACQKAVD